MSAVHDHERRSPAFYATLGLFAGVFVLGSAYSLFLNPHGLRLRAGGAFQYDALGVLVATGLTIALYSFLYEDNPFFKAAEHLYVGVGLGYTIVIAWFDYIKPEAYKQLLRYAVRRDVPGHPEYWLVVPALVLSALMLARFFPRLAWLSRIPVAFIVGLTAATQIPAEIQSNVLKQVQDTIVPLSLRGIDGVVSAQSIAALFSQLVIIVGVSTVLLYFFFSVEHRGAVGLGSRVGVWFLMVAFGASFGYTVMGRMSLLVVRIHFLLGEWLRV
ncbi:MAG TPA: hypothetical protein VHF22_11520 [Planctomycetota bacterium]|nr:hypothetical protein [Planctomycetota bacterium]